MSRIHPPAVRPPRERASRLLASLPLLALAVLLTSPVQTAHAWHMDRVGVLEQSWDGVAIKGYDPVAYFELDRAMQGSKEFRHEWLGQEWHFVNAGHRDGFEHDGPDAGGTRSGESGYRNGVAPGWHLSRVIATP